MADNPTSEDEAIRRRAVTSKLVSASFGEIVSVLMRAQPYRQYMLQDLEWLVVPAVTTNQFMLAEARSKESGFISPIGVVLWAHVSPEVDQRLMTSLGEPVRLRPDEWRSGPIAWMVDAVGAPQIVQSLVKRMHDQVFKGAPVKVRVSGPDGTPQVRVLQAPEIAAAS